MNDSNLVPGPKHTIFDAVNAVVPDADEASAIIANPELAKNLEHGTLAKGTFAAADDACACGDRHEQEEQPMSEPNNATNPAEQAPQPDPTVDETGDITLVSYSQIGMATAQDVREALHQVIDPELGIDVIDLGLVYGIEIDELGRAIITMTLTTPACPLTDLIEDECASTLAGLVEEFRIDWTWTPRWTVDKIMPEGREQLAALGFNLDALPRY
ncbi:metal-sulfur cluster assembly factor [Bifidobacterium choloepi]|uniref:Metal-sulfur cluster assembly factor n=1 Tax=Bifidobacterium choloepi TaxID=2614131 RepID=A0A6I5MZJ0_9BIFI|nr:metal-sulfur cluster assembly factor [Bifidobacterium choloepi]NEG69245.1 metal-sulfur cluster assembly factor [Bifidobacterium choloepi]